MMTTSLGGGQIRPAAYIDLARQKAGLRGYVQFNKYTHEMRSCKNLRCHNQKFAVITGLYFCRPLEETSENSRDAFTMNSTVHRRDRIGWDKRVEWYSIVYIHYRFCKEP